MKINKAKLLVGTLAIASVAATVGSISGTVAWFQYSTRSTAAYSGATAHCSENLQIRLFVPGTPASGEPGDPSYVPAGAPTYDSGWKADLLVEDVQDYIKHVRSTEDYDLRPVTSGAALKGTDGLAAATTFYKSPIYQYSAAYGATHAWRTATALDYVELPIELRVLDRNGETTDKFLAKDVYLTDLTINSTSTSPKGDITDALRVSFDAANDVTFSKKGGTIATTGSLDLNADGKADKEAGYEDFQDDLDEFVYGTAEASEDTVEIETAIDEDGMLADDADPENIVGKKIGSTTTDTNLAVTVRIYLEGWQTLDNVTATATDYDNLVAMQEAVTAETFTPVNGTNYKTKDGKIYKFASDGNTFTLVPQGTVWDDDTFVSAGFQVGMRFSVPAHRDAAE